jgi:hypothetical protein
MSAQDASRIPMVQFLSPDGTYGVPAEYAEYGKIIADLKEEDFLKFYRHMSRMRRFDNEAIGSLPLARRPPRSVRATQLVRTTTSSLAIANTA